MTNQELLQEFMKAFFVTAAFFVVVMLVLSFLAASDKSPPKGVESPRFGVVDKYKGCDVVRYTPENDARHVYFLDCGR
jgi:hypothetical protein